MRAVAVTSDTVTITFGGGAFHSNTAQSKIFVDSMLFMKVTLVSPYKQVKQNMA